MKIIAYYEPGWFPEVGTDFSVWDHLCRAYGVEFQMLSHWREAVVPEGARVVLFDESGETTLAEHEVDLDAVYVFGRTALNLPFEVGLEGFYDEVVRIPTPQPITLFGFAAAAILLGGIR